MIKVDFENDWREFLEQDVALYASQYDPSRTRKKTQLQPSTQREGLYPAAGEPHTNRRNSKSRRNILPTIPH
jgi:hypothetical protein